MGNSTSARIDRVRTIHRALTDGAPTPLPPLRLSDAVGTVPLRTPSRTPSRSLDEMLRERRSRYDYAPLGHDDVSSLLRWALGPQRTAHTAASGGRTLNLHPSAGGLPSTTAYLVVLQPIEDVPPGVYTFHREAHHLVLRRTGDVRGAMAQCLVQPEFAERAPVILVLVGELEAALARYSERHYRTLHVDAGLAAANLYLVATAFDLACCAISGFYDNRLAEALSLTESQIPLLTFAVGARRQIGEQR